MELKRSKSCTRFRAGRHYSRRQHASHGRPHLPRSDHGGAPVPGRDAVSAADGCRSDGNARGAPISEPSISSPSPNAPSRSNYPLARGRGSSRRCAAASKAQPAAVAQARPSLSPPEERPWAAPSPRQCLIARRRPRLLPDRRRGPARRRATAWCSSEPPPGGPPALDALLSRLPIDFPWPLVVAQHMPRDLYGAARAQVGETCARCHVREVTFSSRCPCNPAAMSISRSGDADIIVTTPAPRGCRDGRALSLAE